MKFSVLLPTRNGGGLLGNCVRSILGQSYGNLELIVSDNANDDETPAVIEKFVGDPRLKVLRHERVLPVTENWNRALEAASGDYILMMGDDDYLLPGYFARMTEILAHHRRPDCVLYNAYSYVTPDAISGNHRSFYAEWHFDFGSSFDRERELMSAERLDIVRDMFRFKVRIPLNMQTTLVARAAGQRVAGGMFQPPFPDHYALTSLLLTAARWVYVPERLLVVGISPKSFGHYVYSHEPQKGLTYLGSVADFPGRLPGNELTNGMHAWLNLLQERYPDRLRGIKIDRAGYVRRQFYAWCMQYRYGAVSAAEVLHNIGRLSLRDRLRIATLVADRASWQRFLRAFRFPRMARTETLWHRWRRLSDVGNIKEFADWVARRSSAMDSQPR